jgi:hypothetical protein
MKEKISNCGSCGIRTVPAAIKSVLTQALSLSTHTHTHTYILLHIYCLSMCVLLALCRRDCFTHHPGVCLTPRD